MVGLERAAHEPLDEVTEEVLRWHIFRWTKADEIVVFVGRGGDGSGGSGGGGVVVVTSTTRHTVYSTENTSTSATRLRRAPDGKRSIQKG